MSKKAIHPRKNYERVDDDSPNVGVALHLLREQLGLSLEKLAKMTGVSRAMLGQIELGQSIPTIKTVWRIAKALEVPFSMFLNPNPGSSTSVIRRAGAKILASESGVFFSRALFPINGSRRVEFYELKLCGHSEEVAEPHAPGTTENLVVAKGRVTVVVGQEKHDLKEGDAIFFEADQPHAYVNKMNADAIIYLVMHYQQVA